MLFLKEKNFKNILNESTTNKQLKTLRFNRLLFNDTIKKKILQQQKYLFLYKASF